MLPVSLAIYIDLINYWSETLCEVFFDQYNPPNASKMKEHILNNKVARFYVYTTKPHCLIW